MRLAGLTFLLTLAIAAPAMAASLDVRVEDDFFDPSPARVQPGDTVTWRWAGANQHNVVATANQTERFRSKLQSSGSFARTFSKPGRFTYVCEIHSTMRGAVEVGPAPFPDTVLPRVTGARGSVSRRTAKVTFRLSERARVRVTLSGPSKRIVARTLGTGRRSVTFRNLRAGTYRAGLRVRDTAGNAGRASRTKRFRVR